MEAPVINAPAENEDLAATWQHARGVTRVGWYRIPDSQ